MASNEIYSITDEAETRLRMIERGDFLRVRMIGDPFLFLDEADVIDLYEALGALIERKGWKK